jgi:NTE family protein
VLPKDTPNPFQVIAGTSAGALNAVALASHAQRLRTGVRTLEHVWKHISSDQVYTPYSGNLLASASSVVLSALGSNKNGNTVALLNNAPLRQLLGRVVRFERIGRNLRAGNLRAVSVTASAYGSGESVSFYEAIDEVRDWRGPHRRGLRSRLSLDHLMASSAIPVIFPAVPIDGCFYGDGAVRQVAPTSPALHMGAERVLAIGVSGNNSRSALSDSDSVEGSPSLLQIVGHIMNGAFVDTLENDLDFLRDLNEAISHVPRSKRAAIGHREVKLLEIAPSRALNEIAMDFYDELPRPMSRYIKSGGSGSMLSLVLFESGFCGALCRLGYEDAMAQEQEIREFFLD